jgi:hypothetical protein
MTWSLTVVETTQTWLCGRPADGQSFTRLLGVSGLLLVCEGTPPPEPLLYSCAS